MAPTGQGIIKLGLIFTKLLRFLALEWKSGLGSVSCTGHAPFRHMVSTIAVIIASNALVMVWVVYWIRVMAKLQQSLAFDIAEGVVSLDSNLTETVAKLQSGDLFNSEGFEPPSPIAQMAADYLRARINPTLNVTEIQSFTRDDDGKFASDNS